MTISSPELTSAWEVFLLFLIPVGGGIPAGVLLAQTRGLQWPLMIALYAVSDMVLACLFEPLMWLLSHAGKRSAAFARFLEAAKMSIRKTTADYGVNPSPLTLIMISFGIDPMVGRSAALFAGHGFVVGWTLAILGDLIFFTTIMVSTIWLNNILGDGTWTAIIIMVAMFVVPSLIRRLRNRNVHKK